MAGRIRTLKPEMIEDTKTASLSHLEWRLFVSLILLADDYGNLRAETAYLRGQALWACETPMDDVQNALNKLARVQLTTTYRVRGQNYLHLTTWDRHQKVDKPGKQFFRRSILFTRCCVEFSTYCFTLISFNIIFRKRPGTQKHRPWHIVVAHR